MKKTLYMLVPAFLLFSGVALAQEKKKETKDTKKVEKKEIIIEEKSTGKSEKMVIVIDGDKVTINGKPADDYKGKKHIVIDDDIIINGDRVHLPRKGRVYAYGTGVSNKAMLGVVTGEDTKGAKVNEVIKESAAEKAGIKEGDIITKINDAKIEGHSDLVTVVGKMKPADVADVTFLRDGKEKKVKATLGKSKSPQAWSFNGNDDFHFDYDHNFDFHPSPPMAFATPRMSKGFRLNDDDMWVFRSDRPKYGMSIEDYADGDGVKITSVDAESNAEKAGLKVSDIITEVEGKPIKGTDALREALMDSKDKATISMKVLRNGATESVTVRVPKLIKKADL
jgi:serine protease Do